MRKKDAVVPKQKGQDIMIMVSTRGTVAWRLAGDNLTVRFTSTSMSRAERMVAASKSAEMLAPSVMFSVRTAI